MAGMHSGHTGNETVMDGRCPQRPRESSRSLRGFTLIELLLVIAIMGIVVAITMPNFIRSIRGNRLRTAARSVVTAGRYARSMAVLEQKEIGVTFNLARGKISVHLASSSPSSDAESSTNEEAGVSESRDGFDGGEGEDGSVAIAGTAESDEESPAVTAMIADRVELDRDLDRVKIEYVEVAGEEKISEGRCSVVYRSNGMCTPYQVRIADETGSAVTIDVDAFSAARTERE